MGGFTYTLSDGSAETSGEVAVDVAPVNDPPVAVADSSTVEASGTVLIEASALLANDTDADSETLTVTGVGGAVNGSVRLEGDAIIYVHDGSETTAGEFTYTISDSALDATGAVKIDVTASSAFPTMLVLGLLIGAAVVAIALLYMRTRRPRRSA